jgi:Spy/CpxP family protein refolding chaperone
MRNSLLKFALAASLILNLAVITTAGYHYYQQSRSWVTPLGRVMEKDKFLFEELFLKPEQLSAMKSKAIHFHGEIDTRRKKIEQRRKELIALLRADNTDQRFIDAVIRDIGSNQEAMRKMVALHMLEIKRALEKNQQQKFFDLIEGAMTRSGSAACMPKDGAF